MSTVRVETAERLGSQVASGHRSEKEALLAFYREVGTDGLLDMLTPVPVTAEDVPAWLAAQPLVVRRWIGSQIVFFVADAVKRCMDWDATGVAGESGN